MKTNIGQNIRSLRLKRHISQEELAETTGVNCTGYKQMGNWKGKS